MLRTFHLLCQIDPAEATCTGFVLNVELLTVMSRMSGIDDFVPSFIVSLLTVQQISEEFLPEN